MLPSCVCVCLWRCVAGRSCTYVGVPLCASLASYILCVAGARVGPPKASPLDDDDDDEAACMQTHTHTHTHTYERFLVYVCRRVRVCWGFIGGRPYPFDSIRAFDPPARPPTHPADRSRSNMSVSNKRPDSPLLV